MNATIQSPSVEHSLPVDRVLVRLGRRLKRLTDSQLAWGAVILSALIALVSLKTRAIAYDPASWVVWARELIGPWKLQTTSYGTAWKPLPVFLIAPFTLITRGIADMYWWLFLARFGSILGVFAAGALAKRYAGWAAAILTATLVVISPWWLIDTSLGKAEPLAAALGLMVVLAHHKGWIRFGCVLLLAMGLLRPEVTPIAFVYGVWLVRTHRLTIWELILGGAIMIFLWAIPQELHAGTTAIGVAQHGGALSNVARNSRFPFVSVIVDAASYMRVLPAVLGAAAIVLVGRGYWRRRRGTGDFSTLMGKNVEERVIVGLGVAWILIVALMTEVVRTAGAPRYNEPGILFLLVAGSVLAVRLAGSSKARTFTVVLFTLASTLAFTGHNFNANVSGTLQRSQDVGAMQHQAATLRCDGPMVTQHQLVSILAVIAHQSLPESLMKTTKRFWFYNVMCKTTAARLHLLP